MAALFFMSPAANATDYPESTYDEGVSSTDSSTGRVVSCRSYWTQNGKYLPWDYDGETNYGNALMTTRYYFRDCGSYSLLDKIRLGIAPYNSNYTLPCGNSRAFDYSILNLGTIAGLNYGNWTHDCVPTGVYRWYHPSGIRVYDGDPYDRKCASLWGKIVKNNAVDVEGRSRQLCIPVINPAGGGSGGGGSW